MHHTFLHHHKENRKHHLTIRVHREIRLVKTQAFNSVAHDEDHNRMFLVTKGDCERAIKLGRVRLNEYTGKWPRCALLWKRFKEIVNE